ncbi:MAG: nicotinate phosphoribosyltransferase [Bacillota bacterium]|nr:nicotinate phosphoribosyltransferase [Bacillota bacterium]
MRTHPLLLMDYYKAVHSQMLPQGITKSVSYFTPRMSRIERWQEVVMFGLQAFIKTYLIDCFNEDFFARPKDAVVREYARVLDATLGKGTYDGHRVGELHDLGYLPIEIRALKEGTRVPMHVPMFAITNTHPDFAWLPQALESLISAEMWHPMISATVGASYREIVDAYAERTCDDSVVRARLLGDFSFRGQESLQSAVKSSAGWCLSFLNTATVPAIPFLERNYRCDCEKEAVAYGSPSTEHSVMCSNYSVDGDEVTLLRRLLTEIYPNTSFSAVLDSYDYWNVIDHVLPQLKEEILAHNGCMLMRGDSGDCVDVVTRTVFKLWEQFGGTVNAKGYKVLDPHVKAIYGDSITLQRCEAIYRVLEEHGFAISNVALGAGSFSMQCVEENGVLKPFTRDTFSFAIKATYMEIGGKPYPIFKDPKDGGFKKSQRGCCIVTDAGGITYRDGYTWEEADCAENLLEPVFVDGKLLREQSLADVRRALHGGRF